jgi:hypothetical protein
MGQYKCMRRATRSPLNPPFFPPNRHLQPLIARQSMHVFAHAQRHSAAGAKSGAGVAASPAAAGRLPAADAAPAAAVHRYAQHTDGNRGDGVPAQVRVTGGAEPVEERADAPAAKAEAAAAARRSAAGR